jgi:hypothetical protein
VDFEFRHQQQIEHAEALIVLVHDDGPARRRMRKKIRVPNERGATVTHMNGEWPKWLSAVYVPKLLDCHIRILPRTSVAAVA